MIEKNMTMLTDFYEFTMAHGYFEKGMGERRAYFDMFYRRVPDGGGYAIMAGVEQLVEYLENLQFTDEDIAYLRGRACFSDAFLAYLKDFKFECDVWAVPEGTPIFPGEPIVTVAGPMIQAQFLETMILLTINHQTLIATKASRITRAAKGRTVLEFGSRRAQGYDGAVYGARASYIGGCHGTACVMADRDHHIPAGGTMAHSWVQMFPSEYDAFKAYAEIYPTNCVFLVDTYNVLKSGVPNAIRCANEILAPMGIRPKGIRLDSGDIAYLSIKAREMLDAAGYPDMQIMASNSLDEYLVSDLLAQGARIDSFGIGERLITSKSEPVFGGVYKLSAVEDQHGNIVPKINVSENVEKIRRSTACLTRQTARPSAMCCASTTKPSTLPSPIRCLTQFTRGNRKSSPITRPSRCSCSYSAKGKRSMRRPISRPSAATASLSLTHSGSRPSALNIRRRIMWICPKNCGRSSMTCWKAAVSYNPAFVKSPAQPGFSNA